MTLTIELQRVGRSTVSFKGIPIQARIIQGGIRGDDLLEKSRMTDVEGVKKHVKQMLENRFHATIDINWQDRTDEIK